MTARAGKEARDAEFTAYLEARRGRLLRTAYLLTGDPHQAEDVLQTALAKLYLAWDKVRAADSMDAYVRRSIVNEQTSLFRRAWRRREHSTDQVPEGAPHLDEYAVLDAGRDRALWEAVMTLPPKARAVLVLRYYEQLSEAETADALGISVGTVKSQCSRAIAALRERVPDHLHPRHEQSTQQQEGEDR